MCKMKARACLVVACAGVCIRICEAGDLNPPAGPVAPTHKTLTEVEPRIAINATNTPGDADSLFKITQRGSYYLTGNITGVASKHGVEITASGVTVDLKGFDLAGVAGSLDGVSVTVGGLSNITVVNGSVRTWGANGVDLSGSSNSRVAEISASSNSNFGIVCSFSACVTGCTSQGNLTGITTGVNCTVSNCVSHDNTTGAGFSVGSGSVVSSCTAFSNAGDGIVTGDGCTVTGCTSYLNTGDGIDTDIANRVADCSAYNNTGNGIVTGSGNTVLDCTVNFNDMHGISTSAGSMVANCTARLNTLDGIRCTSASLIRGNACSSNGNSTGDGANIHATSSDNRIEGNNCNGADRGIDVDAAGNVIIKNTCSGNTIDWVIAANNVFGPILDRRAPASAAVSGFAAASSLGTTDANANFTY